MSIMAGKPLTVELQPATLTAIQTVQTRIPGTRNKVLNVLLVYGVRIRNTVCRVDSRARVSLRGELDIEWPFDWQTRMVGEVQSQHLTITLLPWTIKELGDTEAVYPDGETMCNHLIQVGAACVLAAGRERTTVQLVIGEGEAIVKHLLLLRLV